MDKIRSILYTVSTILIIVGALFILQDDAYGMYALGLGLVLNMVYRTINLDIKKIAAFHWLEILRVISIVFMAAACLSFVLELEQKFNLLILAIIVDLLVNIKDISIKKKS